MKRMILLILLMASLLSWDKVFGCSADKIQVQHSKKDGVHTLDAHSCFQAPRALVWRVLADQAAHAEFMPNTVSSKVLSHQGNTLIVEKKIKMFWKTMTTRMRVRLNPQSKMSWEQTQGSFERNQGYYHITPKSKAQTRVHYHIVLKPGFYIPGWVLRSITSDKIEKLFVSISQRAQTFKAGNNP